MYALYGISTGSHTVLLDRLICVAVIPLLNRFILPHYYPFDARHKSMNALNFVWVCVCVCTVHASEKKKSEQDRDFEPLLFNDNAHDEPPSEQPTSQNTCDSIVLVHSTHAFRLYIPEICILICLKL